MRITKADLQKRVEELTMKLLYEQNLRKAAEKHLDDIKRYSHGLATVELARAAADAIDATAHVVADLNEVLRRRL